mmetsp:Transcript_41802/g.81988  ORF Transcript_41802/g.81988 Transcript_41802/m.81988 type:complete len:800 (+) Transcript_41802:33-2432(+)
MEEEGDWDMALMKQPSLSRQKTEGPCDWCDGEGCDECNNTGRAKNDVTKGVEQTDEAEVCDVCMGDDEECEACNGSGFKLHINCSGGVNAFDSDYNRAIGDLIEVKWCEGYNVLENKEIDGNMVRYKITVPIAKLNLEDEICRAWSLNPAHYFLLDFQFGERSYWKPLQADISIRVYIVSEAGSSEAGAPWKLHWTIEDYLKRMFCKADAARNCSAAPRNYDPAAVKDIMELTGCNFAAVYSVWQDMGGDKERVRDKLLEKDTKQKIAKVDKLQDKQHFRDLQSTIPNSCSSSSSSSSMEDTESKQACSSSGGVVSSHIAELQSWWELLEQTGALVTGLEHLFLQHNLTLRVLKTLEQAVKTINTRCLMCHGAVTWVGMKPSVCASPLCKMSTESFGLAFDLAQELSDAPEVVDLLITMAYCATYENNGACMNFVTPVTVEAADPLDPNNTVGFRHTPEHCAGIEKQIEADLNSNHAGLYGRSATRTVSDWLKEGERETRFLDKDKLRTVLALVPSVRDMIAMSQPLDPNDPTKKLPANKAHLEKQLRALHPLLPGLVQWCIQSQRAHFRLLGEEEQMKSVTNAGAKDCVQFAFIQSKPEIEHKFLTNKQRVEGKNRPGSVWSWHGSPVGNWHPITRVGLLNLSNTRYMRVGAAYGNGIYTAVDAQTSAGSYCQAGGWPNSMFGTGIKLLALCEIINEPLDSSGKSIKMIDKDRAAMRYIKGNDWWIVEDEASIVTRFLFLLKPTDRPNIKGSAITDQPKLMSGKALRMEGQDRDVGSEAVENTHKKRRGFGSVFSKKK